MKVTYLGTTVLLFDDGIDQILFDAHFTRPSLKKMIVGTFETNRDIVNNIIEQYKMNRLKGIFISHSHHDHVLDAPYVSTICDANIYGSKSVKNVALGGNVKEDKIFLYEDKMEYIIGDFYIKVIPSKHSKAHWYNDDLGKTIDNPLKQPAKKKDYKEGGSFDFYIKHKDKSYLIRPSYNYIEGQFDDINADILFLGIAGISKSNEKEKELFFKETIEKVKPNLVIPLHWDNFFKPLDSLSYNSYIFMENTNAAMLELAKYCGKNDINCVVQLPLTSIEI